jgi:hypothetical protein
MKGICVDPQRQAVNDAVAHFLWVAEMAKSAELTISISRDAIPTISCTIEELPIVKGGAE